MVFNIPSLKVVRSSRIKFRKYNIGILIPNFLNSQVLCDMQIQTNKAMINTLEVYQKMYQLFKSITCFFSFYKSPSMFFEHAHLNIYLFCNIFAYFSCFFSKCVSCLSDKINFGKAVYNNNSIVRKEVFANFFLVQVVVLVKCLETVIYFLLML